MAKHEYGGININENKGAFAIGEQNTVNQKINNEGIKDLTSQLQEILKNGNFPEERKTELKEIVEAARDSAEQPQLNKPVLKSLLGSANTLTKTPALITTYDKWAHFVHGIIPQKRKPFSHREGLNL